MNFPPVEGGKGDPSGLAIWNGFLLPLILTQSPDKRLLPLALWSFQGQYRVNVPAVLASVMLTTLPILIHYVVGRRRARQRPDRRLQQVTRTKGGLAGWAGSVTCPRALLAGSVSIWDPRLNHLAVEHLLAARWVCGRSRSSLQDPAPRACPRVQEAPHSAPARRHCAVWRRLPHVCPAAAGQRIRCTPGIVCRSTNVTLIHACQAFAMRRPGVRIPAAPPTKPPSDAM